MLHIHQIKYTYDEYHSTDPATQLQVKMKQKAKQDLEAFRRDDIEVTDFHVAALDLVARVDAETPEEAFHIMNRWADEDEAKVVRIRPLHSLSMGDVVVDHDNREAWLCRSVGWQQIDWDFSFEVA